VRLCRPYDAQVLARDVGGGAQLRSLEPWQAEEFAAHVERVRAHLAPWIPFASRVVDAESARELLQDFAARQAGDTGRIYGIWVDDELVGGTLFRVFDTGAGMCEIGVWLAPEMQGRGLITCAARHMIDWAVDVRGLNRVEWRTDPHNEPSRAVARRLGMTLEGTLRSSFQLGSERRDTEVWAVLADEWRSAAR
jgi:ribosomal-protein-serine acetyltransferase